MIHCKAQPLKFFNVINHLKAMHSNWKALIHLTTEQFLRGLIPLYTTLLIEQFSKVIIVLSSYHESFATLEPYSLAWYKLLELHFSLCVIGTHYLLPSAFNRLIRMRWLRTYSIFFFLENDSQVSIQIQKVQPIELVSIKYAPQWKIIIHFSLAT